MAENFNQAWMLLGVGMLTVFTVLLLVVLIGKAAILFTNRFSLDTTVSAEKDRTGKEIEASKISAIVAAVKKVTGGKGDVVSIGKKH